MDRLTAIPLPLGLSAIDVVALVLLGIAWFGVGHLVEHPPARWPSVSVLMKRYRRDWMREFLTRDTRIFDGNMLSTLREGTSFFASACMIAIGGGLALIGNTDPLAGLARELDGAEVPSLMLKLKLVLMLLFVANALMKFIWSHRLFGYCAVMMAAIPNDPDHPQARTRAEACAEVNIHAARNFNNGLRSVYFALGTLGWMAGATGLIGGTAVVTIITLRREFASGSRRAVLRDLQRMR